MQIKVREICRMSKLLLVGIFTIIMVVITVAYLQSKDQFNTEYVQQTFRNLQAETTKFTDGSQITYLVPDQPEGEKVKPSQELIEKASAENATDADKAIEQIITPVENIVQYQKNDPKGVVISGYVLLKDEITGENIQPYVFKVLIEIQCDDEKNLVDGYNYCSTKGIFGRVETEHGGKDDQGNDLGGYFEYVWHPKFADSSAFYDINILVTKDQAQLDGTYKDYEKSYKIQVL